MEEIFHFGQDKTIYQKVVGTDQNFQNDNPTRKLLAVIIHHPWPRKPISLILSELIQFFSFRRT